jgi:hypothetical protein
MLWGNDLQIVKGVILGAIVDTRESYIGAKGLF